MSIRQAKRIGVGLWGTWWPMKGAPGFDALQAWSKEEGGMMRGKKVDMGKRREREKHDALCRQ